MECVKKQTSGSTLKAIHNEKHNHAAVHKNLTAKGYENINTMGCSAACPKCLRTCTLNSQHYGSHECSEGHSWT